jgi:transposase-like protein
MIRSLVPLGLMHVQELLDEEIDALASGWYHRKGEETRGRRHGSNPGSIPIAGQRVPIRVPRIRSTHGGEIPLRTYAALRQGGTVDERLLKRVLYGISCRNYEAAAEAIPGAIGLSSSTVSRHFVQASAAQLKTLQERDLAQDDIVAVVIDGKTFAETTMVVALGVIMTGEKRFLGFIETDTENEQVLTPFLHSLLDRGLDISQGILVLLNGGKGLRAAWPRGWKRP